VPLFSTFLYPDLFAHPIKRQSFSRADGPAMDVGRRDGRSQALPPGHYLFATDRHFQLQQYWDFNYPAAADPRPRSGEEHVAESRHVPEVAL